MIKNFKDARNEARAWTFGMGDSVTDKKAPKRIAKASKKDIKGFIKEQKKTLNWAELM
jgi:hypothetical protein